MSISSVTNGFYQSIAANRCLGRSINGFSRPSRCFFARTQPPPRIVPFQRRHSFSSINTDTTETNNKSEKVDSVPLTYRQQNKKAAIVPKSPVKRVKRSSGSRPNSKMVTAYCSAEQYDLKEAARVLKLQGYQLDPYEAKQDLHLVHFRLPLDAIEGLRKPIENSALTPMGDVFVFPSGTVVAWGVPEKYLSILVSSVLLSAAQNPHTDEPETEDLKYLEDSTRDHSSIHGDTIILGTKSLSNPSRITPDTEQSKLGLASAPRNHCINQTLIKLAFSWGLARSTKLAVLEGLLAEFNESTRSIPTMMSNGSKLSFKRDFVTQKTGQFLTIRAQLNLYSELTDSLPELFWDSPHELGLERYFDDIGRTLDIGIRIRDLNRRLDYSGDIVRELKEHLNTTHGTRLEWIIIWLIFIEVIFGTFHFLRDAHELGWIGEAVDGAKDARQDRGTGSIL